MHPSTSRRSGALLKVIAAPFALLIALAAFLLAPVAAASAAEIPGAITAVTTDKTSYGYTERLKLTFTWAAPDSSVAGDTFTLDLPNELKAVTIAKFALLAPDGSVVANAAWSGKQVVFTLTDYVDTHDAVGGSGFLTVQWDHTYTPVTSQPVVLTFNGVAVEVIIGDKPAPQQPCTENCPPAPPTPTTRSLSKSGGWADGSYEGTRDETHNLNWSIRLPGNETGFAGPIAIVDTPGVGSVIECGTVALVRQTGLAGSAVKSPVDPSRYTVDCSTGTLSIQLDTIAPNEFVTVDYKGTITDQRSGVYGNSVTVTIAGESSVQQRTMKRTDAGGIGGGIQSVSVGDYVWLDADRDGLQDAAEAGIPGVTLVLTGPTGGQVTGIDGKPVAPAVTNAQGGYGFANLPALPAGQHYTVTIDEQASAEVLKDLLPTTANTGDDRSVDSSTGSAESSDLTTHGAEDLTLDFGFVVFELPTLPLPEPPTPATNGGLAFTGAPVALAAVPAALVLIALGAAAVLLARRARVSR